MDDATVEEGSAEQTSISFEAFVENEGGVVGDLEKRLAIFSTPNESDADRIYYVMDPSTGDLVEGNAIHVTGGELTFNIIARKENPGESIDVDYISAEKGPGYSINEQLYYKEKTGQRELNLSFKNHAGRGLKIDEIRYSIGSDRGVSMRPNFDQKIQQGETQGKLWGYRGSDFMYKISEDGTSCTVTRVKNGAVLDEIVLPLAISNNMINTLVPEELSKDTKAPNSMLDDGWRREALSDTLGINWETLEDDADHSLQRSNQAPVETRSIRDLLKRGKII